jgi:hypothetical protein
MEYFKMIYLIKHEFHKYNIHTYRYALKIKNCPSETSINNINNTIFSILHSYFITLRFHRSPLLLVIFSCSTLVTSCPYFSI